MNLSFKTKNVIGTAIYQGQSVINMKRYSLKKVNYHPFQFSTENLVEREFDNGLSYQIKLISRIVRKLNLTEAEINEWFAGYDEEITEL